MRVEVSAEVTSEGLLARCWVVNDGGEVVELDERCLVGPNVVPAEPPAGFPLGVSVSAYADAELHRVHLLPWQIVGRERRFPSLRGARATVHAYLVREAGVPLGLQGPLDGRDVVARAVPFEVGGR